jgi:choline-sulfatase
MTSRYPGQIGLRKMKNGLPPSLPVLSTWMKSAGYRTAAVVTNPYLAPVFGFARDFDDYILLPPESLKEGRPKKIPRGRFALAWDADVVTGAALEWLKEHEEEKYFLWLHFMDPHIPYASLKKKNTGWPDEVKEEAAEFLRDPVLIHRKCRQSELSGEAKEAIRSFYREDIAFFDRHFSKLLARVRRGLDSGKLLLVFTSDHGEEFWEHGCFEHGHTMYDELLTVPLIIAWPGHLPENRVIRTQVGLIDVVPTILQLCGLKIPGGTAGKSLVPLLAGKPPRRTVFSEGILWGGELKSLRSDAYKVIYNPDENSALAFDLKNDPGETRPLDPAAHPETKRLLHEMIGTVRRHEKEALADVQSEGDEVPPALKDTETWKRLKALGYIPESEEAAEEGSVKKDNLDRRGDSNHHDELPHP